jgi:hypothetical protein
MEKSIQPERAAFGLGDYNGFTEDGAKIPGPDDWRDHHPTCGG